MKLHATYKNSQTTADYAKMRAGVLSNQTRRLSLNITSPHNDNGVVHPIDGLTHFPLIKMQQIEICK